jgi:head-tail adaptor
MRLAKVLKVLLITVSSAFAWLAVGQALAAPSWSPATAFPPAAGKTNAFNPRVAANERGDAVITWNLCYPDAYPCVLQSSVRKAGESVWRSPTHVGSTVEPATLGVDAAGDATAAFWTLGDWPRAADLSASASQWAPPVTLSPQPYAGWDDVALAVNAAGDAAAGWIGSASDVWELDVSRRVAGGQWREAEQVAAGRVLWHCDVAVDDAGNTLAVWTDYTNAYAAFRPASSTSWEAPITLGSSDAGLIKVAFDHAGNATAAWTVRGTLSAAYRPFGERWGAAVSVGTDRRGFGLTAAEGDVVLLVFEDGSGKLHAAIHDGPGRWKVSEIAPFSANEEHLDLASDGRGNAVAVWSDGRIVWGAFRAAGGSWHPSQIAGEGDFVHDVSASVDGTGNAAAVWVRERIQSPYDRTIEFSELHPGGPLLEALTTPARAVMGRRIRMSVRALPWGTRLLGAPLWKFGDGRSGAGAHVVHAYRRRGTYNVSVSQRDVSGATATASTTITIGKR